MSTFEISQDSLSVRRRIRVPEIFQTTNAVQQTAVQIDVPASTAWYIKVRAVAYQSDFSKSASYEEEACFRRASAGNVIRASANGGVSKPILSALGDFIILPDLDVVANTSSQTIDIKVTGIASTTINWIFDIQTLRNL